MPIFILLSTLTTTKSRPSSRILLAPRQVNQDGRRGFWRQSAASMGDAPGEFDFVNVLEAPDIATVAKVSVALGAAVLDEDRDVARPRDRRLLSERSNSPKGQVCPGPVHV